MKKLRIYLPVLLLLCTGTAMIGGYAYFDTLHARTLWQHVFQAQAKERLLVIQSVLSGRHELVQQALKKQLSAYSGIQPIMMLVDQPRHLTVPSQQQGVINELTDQSCDLADLKSTNCPLLIHKIENQRIFQYHIVPVIHQTVTQQDVLIVKIDVLPILKQAVLTLMPDSLAITINIEKTPTPFQITHQQLGSISRQQTYVESLEIDHKQWTFSFFPTGDYPHPYPMPEKLLIFGMTMMLLLTGCSYKMQRKTQNLKTLYERKSQNLQQLSEITETAGIGYWEWNGKSHRIQLTEAVARMFFLPAGIDRIRYSTFLSAIQGNDDRRLFADKMKRVAAAHGDFEIGLTLADGLNQARSIYITGQVHGAAPDQPAIFRGTVQELKSIVEMNNEIATRSHASCLQTPGQHYTRAPIDLTLLRRRKFERTRIQYYLNLFDSLMVMLDREGCIAAVNNHLQHMLNKSAAELYGTDWFDLWIGSSERHFIKKRYLRCIQYNEPFSVTCENKMRSQNGVIKSVMWHHIIIKDPENRVVGMLCSGIDVSNNDKALELSVRNKQELDAFFESDLIGVISLSLDGKILAANDYVCRLTGYSQRELAGRSIIEPTQLDDMNAWSDQSDTLKKQRFSQTFLCKSGKIAYVDVLMKRVSYAFGRPEHFLCLVIDVSEKMKEKERMLDRERKHRSTLIREVHHRIKNHLQGVIGLLQNNVLEYPQANRFIEKSILQINALAATYGLQSQYGNGEIYLCDLIKCSVEFNQQIMHLPLKRIELSLPNDKPFPLDCEQAVPISLIINELLLNAVKHGNHQADPISVSLVCQQRKYACFTIVNPECSLPESFDLKNNRGLGTGLDLIKVLLPKNTELTIENHAGCVVSRLRLVL